MSAATALPAMGSKRPFAVIDLTDDTNETPHTHQKVAKTEPDTSGLTPAQRDAKKKLWAKYWSLKVGQYPETQRANSILGLGNVELMLRHKLDALETHRKHLFDRKFSYTMSNFGTYDAKWIVNYIQDKMGEVDDLTPNRHDMIIALLARNLPSDIRTFKEWNDKKAIGSLFQMIDEDSGMTDAEIEQALLTGTPDQFNDFVKDMLHEVLNGSADDDNTSSAIIARPSSSVAPVTPAPEGTPASQTHTPSGSPSKKRTLSGTPTRKLSNTDPRQTKLPSKPVASPQSQRSTPKTAATFATPVPQRPATAAASAPAKAPAAVVPAKAVPAIAPRAVPIAAQPAAAAAAGAAQITSAAAAQAARTMTLLDMARLDKQRDGALALALLRQCMQTLRTTAATRQHLGHPYDLRHTDGSIRSSFHSFVANVRDHELSFFLNQPEVNFSVIASSSMEHTLIRAFQLIDREKSKRAADAAVELFNRNLNTAYDTALGALRVKSNTGNAVKVEEARTHKALYHGKLTAAMLLQKPGVLAQFTTSSLAVQRQHADALLKEYRPPVLPGIGARLIAEHEAMFGDMHDPGQIWSKPSRGGSMPVLETAEDFNKFLTELEGDDFTGDTDEGVQAAADRLNLTPVANGSFALDGLSECDLMPHQVIGVDFMVRREGQTYIKEGGHDAGQVKKNAVRGGLLADAMGLGKTVQCLATMVINHPKLNQELRKETKRRLTLIICPIALIHQWKREIENKAPGLFKVGVHHGPTKMRTLKEFKQFDVIITSYGTMAREYPLKKWGKRPTPEEIEADQPRIERQKGNLFRIPWLRLILDEAHTIKNPGSNVSIAVSNLGAKRNWCLTGTPLQNKLEDIYPIFRVLRVPAVHQRASFKDKFMRDSKQGPARLRAALAPYLMRRTEKDKIGGRPILSLPTKHEEMPPLVFSADEQKLYHEVENSMRCEVNRALVEGTAVKQINHFLIMLLRLRQLCIHPFLILEHLSARDDFNQEDFLEAAYNQGQTGSGVGSMADQVARSLAFAGVDESTAMCGICHMNVQEGQFALNCHHVFCAVCVEDTETIVDDESHCPVCNAVLGKLVDFDEKKHTVADAIDDVKIKMDGSAADKPVSQAIAKLKSPVKQRTPIKLLDSDDEDDVGPSTGARRITAPARLDIESDASDEELGDLNQMLRASVSGKSDIKPIIKSRASLSPSKKDRKVDIKDLKDVKDVKPFDEKDAKLRQLKSLRRNIPGMDDRIGCAPVNPKAIKKAFLPDPDDCDPSRQPIPPQTKEEREREQRSWEEIMKLELLPSAKMDAVEAQLEIYIEQDDDKIIIFSQFVKAIDILEKICHERGWPVLRYQGDMSVRQREQALREFEAPDGPRILLMSLKAGGVGLNLVCANKVILIDFWWNAAVEQQAVARCHRLGQKKEVFVQRFYVPGTVEERIVALQEAKLKTAGMVLGEAEGGGRAPRLSLRDIMGLFGTMERNEEGVMQLR